MQAITRSQSIMGKVVVAPPSEIQKTSVRINAFGEEIDPKTKKVISKKEKEYIPTPEELAAAQRKSKKRGKEKEPEAPDNTGGLDAIIAKKLGEKIGDAIGKALENIDMDTLIGNAIDNALKKK